MAKMAGRPLTPFHVRDEIEPLLTPREVAAILRVTPSALCRWRAAGTGPRAVWLTPSTPRYRVSDVQRFIDRRAA